MIVGSAIAVYFLLQAAAFYYWKDAWKAVAVVPLWIFAAGALVVCAIHFFNPSPARPLEPRLLAVTGLALILLGIIQGLIVATRKKR